MKKLTLAERIQLIVESIGQTPEGISHIEVRHQDGCPALKTKRLSDCTCQPVIERIGQC